MFLFLCCFLGFEKIFSLFDWRFDLVSHLQWFPWFQKLSVVSIVSMDSNCLWFLWCHCFHISSVVSMICMVVFRFLSSEICCLSLGLMLYVVTQIQLIAERFLT